MLLEELQEHYDVIDADDIEAGLLMYVDEDGDDIGCYYLCNMETEEVFWLTDVGPNHFIDAKNIPIVSREHLRE